MTNARSESEGLSDVAIQKMIQKKYGLPRRSCGPPRNDGLGYYFGFPAPAMAPGVRRSTLLPALRSRSGFPAFRTLHRRVLPSFAGPCRQHRLKRFSGSFRSRCAGTAPHPYSLLPYSIDSFSLSLYGQTVERGSVGARVVIFMRVSLFLMCFQHVRAGPPVHCQKDGHSQARG